MANPVLNPVRFVLWRLREKCSEPASSNVERPFSRATDYRLGAVTAFRRVTMQHQAVASHERLVSGTPQKAVLPQDSSRATGICPSYENRYTDSGNSN